MEAAAPAGLGSLKSGRQAGLLVGGLCHGADGLYTYRRSSLATPLVQQLLPGSLMEQAWWQSWRRVPAPVRGNFVLQKGDQDPGGSTHENQGRDEGGMRWGDAVWAAGEVDDSVKTNSHNMLPCVFHLAQSL